MSLPRTALVLGTVVALGIGTGAAVWIKSTQHDPLDNADPAVRAAIEESREENPELWDRKLMILAFDSCDPDLLEEYIRAGKASNFARMRREGVHGPLHSLVPVLSPVIWSTVSTGMSPERHGILDFITQGPDGKQRPISSKMLQSDPYWSLISDAGDDVGVVGWLVSFPAEPVNGFVVTDKIGLLGYEARAADERGGAGTVYPLELEAEIANDKVTIDDIPLDRLRAFIDVDEEEYKDSYTKSFEVQGKLTGKLRLLMATAETFRNVSTRLYRERRPRVFTAYFNAMDAISHYFMPYAPPRMPHIPEADYIKYRNVMEANYAWHDRVLGEFMELADEKTTIIVISDHGFKHGALRTTDDSDFRSKTGAMWHRKYGVIYAWGYGIPHGETIHGATVFDIAPTVLASLGYPVPKDMHGRPLQDLFTDELPVRRVPTWYGEQRRLRLAREAAEIDENQALALTPQEREEMELWKSIGYIDPGATGGAAGSANTILNLASRLMAIGKYGEALQKYEELIAVARSGNDPRIRPSPRLLLSYAGALISLAEKLKKNKDLEGFAERIAQAQKEINEARGMAPDDSAVYVLSARVARAEERLEEAERLAREAVRLDPQMPQPLMILGGILGDQAEAARKAGKLELKRTKAREARETYELALLLEPRQFHALVQLAELVLDIRDTATIIDDAEYALELLGRALELIPQSPRAHNYRAIGKMRLGMAASNDGREDDATRLLSDALESSNTALSMLDRYATGWANKAYVLWLLRRYAEAQEAARQANDVRLEYEKKKYEFEPVFVSDMKKHGYEVP